MKTEGYFRYTMPDGAVHDYLHRTYGDNLPLEIHHTGAEPEIQTLIDRGATVSTFERESETHERRP